MDGRIGKARAAKESVYSARKFRQPAVLLESSQGQPSLPRA